ncbi:hypothetical protein I552_1287 [Mycobacterium xenopi 3993]|nr:hypothetical protein I552_1287 [Mycobacterium xenopi 3993]
MISQHLLLTGAPPNRRQLMRILDTVIPARRSVEAGSRGRPRVPADFSKWFKGFQSYPLRIATYYLA